MNDITKARYFLKNRSSGLSNLASFGLMLAAAEDRYKRARMRQVGSVDPVPGNWETQEVEAALDYAVLKYLKKHNQLPKDAMQIFSKETTLEQKKEMAQRWATA